MFTVTEFIAYCLGSLIVGFVLGLCWQSFINFISYISNPH